MNMEANISVEEANLYYREERDLDSSKNREDACVENVEVEPNERIVEDLEVNEPNESSPTVHEATPKAGMVFQSEEEVYSYYKEFAYQNGFGFRKVSEKCGKYGQRYYSLACTKGGKYVSVSKNTFYSRPSTKTECKAKINIIVETDGRHIISRVFLEHNHALSPQKSRFQRTHKKMDAYAKRRIELNDQAGIPLHKNYHALVVEAGGYEKLQFGEKDCRNYISKVRNLRLSGGDAEALQNYFVRMQKRNSKFFHAIDMDDEGHLRNVFWVDARSRAAYESFGDVVSFDSTYLTNRYNMPFAPFVGVNHHGQSILFGCGLISNEDAQTYIWLFKTWLHCMNGRAPKAVITDQCSSIQAAVAEVFPNSHHRLCLWHIMKKIPEKLGGFSEYKAIKKRLKHYVYESLEIEKFDEGWLRMIKEYNLEKNDWLNSLFEMRHRWVPIYVKTTFWAGMSTTQRSESMNSFFDGYVNSKTSLKQFVEQYDNALKSKIEKEARADYDSLNSCYKLVTGRLFEKQFQESYTNAIFKLFQDELRGMLFCNSMLCNVDGSKFIFNVSDIIMGKDGTSEKKVVYNVHFDEEKCDIRCSCSLFEFKGILCRHIAKILVEKKVKEVPSCYILSRWRKDVKHRHYYVANCYDDWETRGQNAQFDKLCVTFGEVADMVRDSPRKCEFLMKCIDEAKKKLEDELKWVDDTSIQENNDVCIHASNSSIKLLSPKKVRSKGRPPCKRKKSVIEKAIKKKGKKVIQEKNKDVAEATLDLSKSKETSEKVLLSQRMIDDEVTWQNFSFTRMLPEQIFQPVVSNSYPLEGDINADRHNQLASEESQQHWNNLTRDKPYTSG